MTDSIHNARLDERYRIADRLDEMAAETMSRAEHYAAGPSWMAEGLRNRADALRDAAEELRRQE